MPLFHFRVSAAHLRGHCGAPLSGTPLSVSCGAHSSISLVCGAPFWHTPYLYVAHPLSVLWHALIRIPYPYLAAHRGETVKQKLAAMSAADATRNGLPSYSRRTARCARRAGPGGGAAARRAAAARCTRTARLMARIQRSRSVVLAARKWYRRGATRISCDAAQRNGSGPSFPSRLAGIIRFSSNEGGGGAAAVGSLVPGRVSSWLQIAG